MSGQGRGGRRDGAGRPAVGERVEIRLPEDALSRIDEYAADHGTTRSAVIRELVTSVIRSSRRERGLDKVAEIGDVDGHSLYGVLEYSDDGERVVCHECGREVRAVGTHAWYAHGITAVQYRAAHGLSTGQSLASPATAARFRALARSERGRAGQEALAASRDPDRARRAMTAEGQQRPQRRAIRAQTGRRARLGREVTAKERARLEAAQSIAAWAKVAHRLVADGVSGRGLARALGMPSATVAQRLRRYPAADASG